MDPLLVFDRVTFSYTTGDSSTAGASPSVIHALQNISLTIDEGEMVAVVGANGSGKSTFARLAAALLLPASGSVRILGLDTRQPANRARIHGGVGIVFQHPEDQIVGTTVEEDVAFGPENLGLTPQEVRERVENALREVGLWEQRGRSPHMLSAGQTQRLALAGVLAMRPHCILFDEATTMLDPGGRRDLMNTMQRLNRDGMTVVYITHFMDEAARARRVIVFNAGQVALDGAPGDIFTSEERLAPLGLDLPPVIRAAEALRPFFPTLPPGIVTFAGLEAVLPSALTEVHGHEPDLSGLHHEDRAQSIIDVEDLGYVYLKVSPLAHRALDGANLVACEGKSHGLLGRTGSGKSTLMQHLNGLLRPQEGCVRVGKFDLSDPRVDRKQVVRQVGLVFQNPEAQFFEHYVGDEIAFGPRQLNIDESLADRVRWAMELVGLDFVKFKDRPLFALSGGERRKVALASTLAIKPSILLMDEPTAGLDPRSRLDLLSKLETMEAGGMTLVLSSHHMEDLAILADSLTVYDHGHDVLAGPTALVFDQVDILRKHGLVPPVAVRLAEALRRKGWPVPVGILDLPGLTESLRSGLGERTGE